MAPAFKARGRHAVLDRMLWLFIGGLGLVILLAAIVRPGDGYLFFTTVGLSCLLLGIVGTVAKWGPLVPRSPVEGTPETTALSNFPTREEKRCVGNSNGRRNPKRTTAPSQHIHPRKEETDVNFSLTSTRLHSRPIDERALDCLCRGKWRSMLVVVCRRGGIDS